MNDDKNTLPMENALAQYPFVDTAVCSLFQVLCKKWLGDGFSVEFLSRADYNKKETEMLKKTGNEKETLSIPKDVASEEMIKILEIAGKQKNSRTTRRAMESPRNELANFLFQKGIKLLMKNMPFDSLQRYAKNALLSWKQGQKTLKEAFCTDNLRSELEEVKKTGNISLIVEKEIEIADKIQMILREYPYLLDSQQPAEIIQNKSINCRGATVLGGAILSEVGIKYLVGDVPKHSILVLLLSDDRLEWRDMQAPSFNEFLTDEMIRGFSKTGTPLSLKDALEYAKDPTPDGLMLDILGDEYRRKLSWVKNGQRQFLTLFPPVLGAQMQVLNGIAFNLNELGLNEKNPVRKNEYFSQAIEACKLSIAYEPKYEYAHNTMGESLCKLGKYDEAIDAFQKSFAINPWNASCHYGLGKAYFAFNKNKESLASYRRYIELADPDTEGNWIDKAKEKIEILLKCANDRSG